MFLFVLCLKPEFKRNSWHSFADNIFNTWVFFFKLKIFFSYIFCFLLLQCFNAVMFLHSWDFYTWFSPIPTNYVIWGIIFTLSMFYSFSGRSLSYLHKVIVSCFSTKSTFTRHEKPPVFLALLDGQQFFLSGRFYLGFLLPDDSANILLWEKH